MSASRLLGIFPVLVSQIAAADSAAFVSPSHRRPNSQRTPYLTTQGTRICASHIRKQRLPSILMNDAAVADPEQAVAAESLLDGNSLDGNSMSLALVIRQMEESDFLDGPELQQARDQIQAKCALLQEAIDKEDYTAAAVLHKELEQLRRQDPMHELQRVQEMLDEAIRKERYQDARLCHSEIMRVRRYLPQYQLAGLWKGSYPGHGEEVVRISYQGEQLVATKVTGDPFVPPGEITFVADVAVPPQESYTSLGGVLGDSITVKVEVHALEDAGSKQLDRFSGQGQVAAHGFQQPRFIPGELFLMEEDMVGFLWLSLGSFVVFNRLEGPEGLTDDDIARNPESFIEEVTGDDQYFL